MGFFDRLRGRRGDPDRRQARLALAARGLLTPAQAEGTPDDCPIALVLASDVSTPVEDDYLEFDAEHYWDSHDWTLNRWLEFHLPPAQRLLARHGCPFDWRLAESIETGPRLVLQINGDSVLLARTEEDEQGWRAGVRLYRHLDSLLAATGRRHLYLTTVNDRMGWVFCWDDEVYALVRRADPVGAPELITNVPIDPATHIG